MWASNSRFCAALLETTVIGGKFGFCQKWLQKHLDVLPCAVLKYEFAYYLCSRCVFLQSVTKMVDRIRKFQILNNQIFALLDKYLEPANRRAQDAYGVKLEHQDPPTGPELLVLEEDEGDEWVAEGQRQSVAWEKVPCCQGYNN